MQEAYGIELCHIDDLSVGYMVSRFQCRENYEVAKIFDDRVLVRVPGLSVLVAWNRSLFRLRFQTGCTIGQHVAERSQRLGMMNTLNARTDYARFHLDNDSDAIITYDYVCPGFLPLNVLFLGPLMLTIAIDSANQEFAKYYEESGLPPIDVLTPMA